MNKKGFTLVEVIVSVILVSIVLISLMATLLKLRSTYSDVNKNTDVLIYGSSLSRVINNDLMEKNGIRLSSCDTNGLSCDFILGNDEQRRLEIIEEEIDHGQTQADSLGSEKVNHKTIKTTLKYTNTTKEKDNDEHEIIYIRTLTREDYTDEKGVHTTDGYSFYSLVSTEMPQDENTENGNLIDIVTKITISMYDGKDINDSTYNVNLYTAGKYDFSNYTGKRFKIEFDLNGADSASGVFGMDEIFGVGYYKQDSKVTSSNRLREIPIPKKNTEAFLGYYYGSTSNDVETQIVDSMGNIVISSRFFKEDVLLPEEVGEESRSWVKAKWGACESPGYRLEDGMCKPNKFTMTLNPNGGSIEKSVYENVVYQSYVPVLTSKPQRAGYEFEGFFSSAVEEDKGYYDNNAEPISVYDIKGNGTLEASWKMCSQNTYSTAEMLYCKNCPNGYLSNAGSDRIEKCYMTVLPGYYLVSESAIATQCTPGTYRVGSVTVYYPNSVSCNKCAPNTYQGSSGATGCIACDPGYESGEGASYESGEGASSCTPKTLKITLNPNNGSGGTTTLYQKYNTGWYSNSGATTPISTISKPSRTGYTFDGYYTLPTGGTKIIDENGSILGNTNKTFVNNGDLYAHWVAHKYVIAYNGNTNTGGSTTSSEHTYDVSKALTANGFSKTGYTFSGWAKTSDGAKVYDDKQSVKNLTSTNNATVNLYAKWNANPYTVVYNGNTNTGGSTANSSHTFDVAKNLNANGFSKTGYTFAGWATSANGEIVYADKASVKNLTTTPEGTFNLYAKWSQNSYTVKYNGNGSTGGSTASSTHTYDETSYLNPNGFERTGYTFAGWATSETGSVVYSDVAQVKNLTPSGVFNLYAKWTANTYTVQYEGNEHTGGSTASSSHTYDVAKNLTANGFIRNGYNFTGWATSPNGNKLYDDQESVKNLATSGTYMLYAKWTPKVLKITLNKNGGSDGTSTIYQKYNTGWYSNAAGSTSITTITKPTQTGKTFDGYFTLPTGGTKIIGEDGKIINGYASTFIEDGDLYAHWTTNTYTVVYNGNTNTGGSTSSSTHTYGVSKALTKNGFIKTNYAFTGWATSASGSVVYTDEEVVKNLTTTQNGTVTLFAKWSQCTNGEGVHAWENGCTIATCEAGYYKDGNTCKYCSAGTNTTAGNTASSCTTCSNSSSVATYSSLCVASTCKAGYYKDGNTCKACSAGTITSEGNVSASCSTCSNSSSVAIYTSLCVANTCKAGYYKNGTTCSACAAGTTTTEGNTSTSCDACTNNTGVNSYSSLCIIANCKAGYYKSGNSCVACASGTYTDSVNTASSCTSCPDGYSVAAGSGTSQSSCTMSVPAGKQLVARASIATNCGANTWRSGPTTVAYGDSVSCTVCPSGYGVAAGSGTSQSSCTMSVPAGKYLSAYASSATNCPAGQYRSGDVTKAYGESIGCSNCVAGSYSGSGSSGCTACAKGTTNGGGASNCPSNCSNNANVTGWNTPSWNSNNTMNYSCSISSCASCYANSGNKCVAQSTLYVSSSGSDSNSGVTTGSPFATIQKAYNCPGNVTIRLTSSITQSSQASFNQNKSVTLTSNSGNLSINRSSSFKSGSFIVLSKGTLTTTNITLDGKNINTDGGHLIQANGGSTLNLNSGTYLQNSNNTKKWNAGSCEVTGNGTRVNINGAVIRNNKTYEQTGGVFVGYGAYGVMNSGEIYGNTDIGLQFYGGSGEVKGGTIYNNVGTNYGAGLSIGENDGSNMVSNVTMSGGTIRNNSCRYGAGILVWNSHGSNNNRASFTMTGGNVYNNTASESGGGLYVQSGGSSINLNGGSIYSNSPNNTAWE